MEYGIREVAEMMNIPISTIRYYDKEGLLPFLSRKESGYRIFKDSDLEMLRVIDCFKSTGMPISQMKEFIAMVKAGDASLQERYDLFEERKRIVNQQIKELEKQMDVIDHKLWYYSTAIEAGTEDIHKEINRPCNTD